MLAAALAISSALLALALALAAWRFARGPDAVDRALALDAMYVDAAALLVVHGLGGGGGWYFEAALLIVMLGFLGTVSFAELLLRGRGRP